MQTAYYLFEVNQFTGTLIAVARNLEAAREYFGASAKIVPIDENRILARRLDGPERVFIVI